MKLAKTLLLAAMVISTSTSCPSYSQGMMNTLQNIAGKFVVNWNDLDTKRTQIETMIQDAVRSGQLSRAHAADFRVDLDRMNQESIQGKASGKRMSFTQSISYGNQLSTLAATVQDAIDHRVATLPVIDSSQLELSTQINAALASGHISQETAASLRAELRHVADIEAAYKVESHGTLTPRQIELLSDAFNRVKANVDLQVKIGQSAIPSLNERRSALEKRMADLIIARQFTNRDAAPITAELQRIATQQAAFQTASGGTLTGSQVLQIAHDLDAVSDQIEARALATVPVTGGFPGPGVGQLPPGGRGSGRSGRRRGARWREQQAARAGQTTLPTSVDVNADAGAEAFPPMELPVISQKSFTDLTGYWGEQYVGELANRGVIGGFPNGTFKPNDNITRAQFAAIVTSALKLPTDGASGASFTDLKSTHWAAPSIAAASNAGLISGFPDGTFKPEDQLTRAQALVILAKALDQDVPTDAAALNAYADKAAVPQWAMNDVVKAANAHIIVSFPSSNQIRPNVLATRGDVAALMYQTLTSLGANLPKISVGLP